MKTPPPDTPQVLGTSSPAMPGGFDSGSGPRDPARDSNAPDESESWDALARELTDAFRMGPGGLSDEQRRNILDHAARPHLIHAGSWKGPRPLPPLRLANRRLLANGLAAAAAIAALLLAAARWLPVQNTIDPGAWAARLGPKSHQSAALETRFHIRMLPGTSAGSRYTANRPVDTLNTTPEDDWSAVAGGGGFQPTALANVAEFIPAPPTQNPPDFLSRVLTADAPPISRLASDLVNHFTYNYPEPSGDNPLSFTVETGPCPWNPGSRLVHIGIRATTNPKVVPGKLSPAASDVRLLVDFNPRQVAAYRLLGHGPESRQEGGRRMLREGADLLAGQAVTVLYELIPLGTAAGDQNTPVDAHPWQDVTSSRPHTTGELLTARVQFRNPGKSRRHETALTLPAPGDSTAPGPSRDFHFASAVAACAMLLGQTPGMNHYQMHDALALAKANVGPDPGGKRSEFIRLLSTQPGL